MPVTINRPISKVGDNLKKPVVVEKEFNPMLAAEGVLGKIKYPAVVLHKHNGVRGLNQQGQLVARSLKPIPNKHTRSLFSGKPMTNFDGELVVGDPFDEEVFATSTSGVMTAAGAPDVNWFLFDFYHPTAPFIDRLHMLAHAVAEAKDAGHQRIECIPWQVIHSDDELVDYSNHALAMGLEGLVIRDPNGTYKEGRSTAGEGGLMRYCPWFRSEAIILAIHEGEVNLNPSKVNELGYLKKSSHKDNKVGSGRAGAFTVKDCTTGLEFNIPVPTVKFQEEVWGDQDKFIGLMIKYKFKPPVKLGGKPRFPQYEGIRSPLDM